MTRRGRKSAAFMLPDDRVTIGWGTASGATKSLESSDRHGYHPRDSHRPCPRARDAALAVIELRRRESVMEGEGESMRKQRWLGPSAALFTAALILAACQGASPSASASSAASASAPASAAPSIKFLACEVTDTGGVDDKGFNQNAHDGLLRAQSELGIQIALLESTADTDYAPNINTFISQGCDLIVTVGFLLGDATKAAATANPNQKFAIVDYAYDPPIPNVLGLVFDTKSASMLQGYLAAGMSQTGIVGTFAGIQISPVTDFMDGYVAGVNYYNKQKGTSVKVIGWDPATATGSFTGDFTDQTKGRTTAEAELQA